MTTLRDRSFWSRHSVTHDDNSRSRSVVRTRKHSYTLGASSDVTVHRETRDGVGFHACDHSIGHWSEISGSRIHA